MSTQLKTTSESLTAARLDFASGGLRKEDFDHLVHDAWIAHQLHQLVNTPELVDFVKAVHMESVHQLDRWGAADREGKGPTDWFWLVGYLAGRALEHHKNAERLSGQLAMQPGLSLVPQEKTEGDLLAQEIAHHREKAVHHVITTAAVCAHWHQSALGNFTGLRVGEFDSASMAARLEEMADHSHSVTGAHSNEVL